MNNKDERIVFLIDREKIIKHQTSTQEYLEKFLEMDKSFLGYLLTLSEEEFRDAYREVSEIESDHLAVDALLILESSGITKINAKDLAAEMLKTEHKYDVISLVRRGLINYEVADSDDKWNFISKKDVLDFCSGNEEDFLKYAEEYKLMKENEKKKGQKEGEDSNEE